MGVSRTDTEAQVTSLIRDVNPGQDALDYLLQQNLGPAELERVLRLMRIGVLDRILDEKATQQ